MLTQHLTLGIALASSPGSQIFNYAWVDITQGPPLTQPHTPVKPDYTLSSTIRRIEKIGGAMECPNTTPGTEDKMEESSETHQDTAHDAKATSKAVGTQACSQAIATISGTVGDLETTAMFCTAGALNPDAGTVTDYVVVSNDILKTAMVLMNGCKKLLKSAGGTQEALAEAATSAVKTITAEAEHVKLGATSLGSDRKEEQLLLLTAVKDVANALGDLIDSTRTASGKSVQDPAMEKLKTSAKEMAGKVYSLVKTVRKMRDKNEQKTTSTEETDSTIATAQDTAATAQEDVFEREMAGAVQTIEAAILTLPQAKSQKQSSADEDLSFNEQILDAAKSVASATSALVKSATAAQRELVAQGKLSSNPKSEDGQWSEEMVSAAKLVASATSNLCETVNSVVTGEAQEEKLIAAVKAVACFTVQLLVACQVKADINSESNRRLQHCGVSVRKEVDRLTGIVSAVVAEKSDEVQRINVEHANFDELQLASKQRELDRARETLFNLQKARERDLHTTRSSEERIFYQDIARVAQDHRMYSGLFAYKTEDTEELKRMYGSEILSDPVDNAVEDTTDEIAKAIGSLDHDAPSPGNYSNHTAKALDHCRTLDSLLKDMVLKSSSSPNELSISSRKLTDTYSQLVDTARGALATTESEGAAKLRKTCGELGEACIQLIHTAGHVEGHPEGQMRLVDCATAASKKLSFVVQAVMAFASGTEACEGALSKLSGMVDDLNEAIKLSANNQLNPDMTHSSDNTKLSSLVMPQGDKAVLEHADQLLRDTEMLMSSAGGTQEALAEAASGTLKTAAALVETVKLWAILLGSDDMEAQMSLLTAVRDVAKTLSDLFDLTCTASRKMRVSDPTKEQLKMSTECVAEKVSSLKGIANGIEAKVQISGQSLETTIAIIEAGINDYNSDQQPATKTSPQDLINSAKAITLAATKAVAAGKSCLTIDISECADEGLKAVGELLKNSKGCSLLAESDEDRDMILAAGHETAEAFKNLLELLHQVVMKPTPDNNAKLPTLSKEVAKCVGEVVHAAESIRAKWRQHLHREAYKRAIRRKTTVRIRPVRFNHLGLPRSGKTSFRRRLLGEIVNIVLARLDGEKVQPSTGVAEDGGQVVIRSVSSDIGTIHSKTWSMLRDLVQEANLINELIYQRDNKEEGDLEESESAVISSIKSVSESVPKEVAPLVVQEIESVTCSIDEQTKSVTSSPEVHEASDPEETLEAFVDDDIEEMFSIIKEAMDKDEDWEEVKDLLEDMILLINTDTGGQAEFLDLQASLVQGPSFNLLFSRLIDELDSQFQVYYTNEEGESTEKEESVLTKEEVLFQSLSSIACFSGSFTDEDEGTVADIIEADSEAQRYSKSKMMFVGTHRDLVSEEEFRRKDLLLQQKIKNTEFYDKGIIEYAAEDQLMLAVDNMNGGQEEIDSIRKLFEKVIERNFKKVEIPASWLMLSLCIRKKKVRTMSLADCEKLAGKLRIGPEELQDALWFLHHCIGVLLYYPEVEALRDIVICDIQVLYDSATRLIKNTFTFDKVGQQASETFREKAQFSLKVLKEALLQHTDDLIPLEKLVELLDYLNILTEIIDKSSKSRDRNFFMPCILRRARPCELCVSLKPADPAPLMIHFNCGYVPVGMFPAMITSLVSRQHEDWEIINEDLRKNRVSFYVGDDYDTVTLISHPRYFQIAISRDEDYETPTESVCASVRGVVQSTLSRVASNMNYHFSMGYKLGFECPSHPGKEHLCLLAREGAKRMQCQETMKPLPFQEHHKVWFKMKVTRRSTSHSLFSYPSICKGGVCLPSLCLLKWTDKQGRGHTFSLIDKTSAKWSDFGLFLGLPLNQLDAFDAQFRGNAAECWKHVMSFWLSGRGSKDYPVSWEGLSALLCDVGFSEVAKELKKARTQAGH